VSEGSSYAQSGNWASSKTKNPIYIGTNSAGTYKYVGQWVMPGLDQSLGTLKRVELAIWRNGNSSSSAHDYYIGCSADPNDSASVLSTGVTFTLESGSGWQFIDVSEIAEHIASYTSTWYLLIGNPNDKSTYAEIAGYGSGHEMFLSLTYSNGSSIMLATGGTLEAYQLYRAENGSLVQYDLYRAENGSLVKY
jgi:hypothetical protein